MAYEKPVVLAQSTVRMAECRPNTKPSGRPCNPDYGTFGYITDNRNFGYKPVNNKEQDIGEKIVSKSGAVFLSSLGRSPRSIDALVKDLCPQFDNADPKMIWDDATAFFCTLESDGFIASGETEDECNNNDTGFSYQATSPVSNTTSCSPKESIDSSTQTFFEEYYHRKPYLTNVHIEITSRCNERCVHCYIPHENKITDMRPDLFYSILDQCKKMNVLHMTLSGGEPMAHKSFLEFLRKCYEYNFSVNVLTNLTMLNPSILNEFKRNRLLCVQTSLYSTNPVIHDAITMVKGSCQKTKEAILTLIDNDIPLQISCPILKQNKSCYQDVVSWGNAHNIAVNNDYVILARCDHTTQNLDNRLTIADVKDLIAEQAAGDPEYVLRIKEQAERNSHRSLDDPICSVCYSSICVSEQGIAYPCAGWQDYALGDLSQISLANIWNRSEKVQYLRSLRRGDFSQCIQCADKDYCTLCMVRNANEDPHGRPLVVNRFFCNVAAANRELAQSQQ